jgi:hypothetical protein
MLPKVVGPCEAAVPAYWHDPATGVCMPFIFGGCDGNANNFPSLEACQMTCSGGQPDMDACSGVGDCLLLSDSCCAACNPNSTHSFVSIRRGTEQEFTRLRGCDGITCGACPPIAEPDSTRQYFIATCEAGRCKVADIRQTALTSCMGNTDCVLRDGAECCEGCDGQGIVAVSRFDDVAKRVCPTPTPGCPPCVPNLPPNVTPLCTNARCTVGFLR